MTTLPFVSVVVPCRDEERHIRRMTASLLANDYPRDRIEILFVDGMSADRTRALVEELAREHPFVRLLDNPKQTAPAAMNLGIRHARGEIIARMDAHSEYPPDYLRRCVELLRETGAGCAGGVFENAVADDSAWARAVAAVTSHRFGVGNSRFRTGGPPGEVDTVPCGVFPRRVFDDVGLYDERLTRNQDNELTARLRKKGYTVVFDPGIRARYYNKPTLGGLVRQGFYNGVWNVYTFCLHPHAFTTRHFVPAAFVAYLAALAAAAVLGPRWAAPLALPLALYGVLVCCVAASGRETGAGAWRVAATVVAYHCSYGFGTHLGLAKRLTGRWLAELGRPLRKR